MFDSPFERCPVCGQFVMLDQTQAQCAREHHCHPSVDCPLRKYFTGHDFGEKKKHPAKALRRKP
ncbi:MAG: hypothetical protein HYU77_17095 [Betaproteobacteria bacterium]|nr:hypothetical protein [Betaproteobacteria bacterium]